MLDHLVEKLSRLSNSDLTQTRKALESHDSHLDTFTLSELEFPLDAHIKDSICFPLELKNSAPDF